MRKPAFEMRISDWSSDVCSSDLHHHAGPAPAEHAGVRPRPHPRNGGCPQMAGRLSGGQEPWPGWLADAVACAHAGDLRPQRKSAVSGTRVSVRVDLGGRRFVNTKNCNNYNTSTYYYKSPY